VYVNNDPAPEESSSAEYRSSTKWTSMCSPTPDPSVTLILGEDDIRGFSVRSEKFDLHVVTL
jgi:hypothetical protein